MYFKVDTVQMISGTISPNPTLSMQQSDSPHICLQLGSTQPNQRLISHRHINLLYIVQCIHLSYQNQAPQHQQSFVQHSLSHWVHNAPLLLQSAQQHSRSSLAPSKIVHAFQQVPHCISSVSHYRSNTMLPILFLHTAIRAYQELFSAYIFTALLQQTQQFPFSCPNRSSSLSDYATLFSFSLRKLILISVTFSCQTAMSHSAVPTNNCQFVAMSHFQVHIYALLNTAPVKGFLCLLLIPPCPRIICLWVISCLLYGVLQFFPRSEKFIVIRSITYK